jgi:hypothetical protein
MARNVAPDAAARAVVLLAHQQLARRRLDRQADGTEAVAAAVEVGAPPPASVP